MAKDLSLVHVGYVILFFIAVYMGWKFGMALFF
jgi:hypothetical protein